MTTCLPINTVQSLQVSELRTFYVNKYMLSCEEALGCLNFDLPGIPNICFAFSLTHDSSKAPQVLAIKIYQVIVILLARNISTWVYML